MNSVKFHKLPMLSDEEEQQFQCTENCCFCNKTLGDDRVRDHDHYTGKYFSAAHNHCTSISGIR